MMLEQLKNRLEVPEVSQTEMASQAKVLRFIYLFSAVSVFLLILFISEPIRAVPAYYLATILYDLAWLSFCLPGYLFLRRGLVWFSALWLATSIYVYISFTLLMTGGVGYSFLPLYLLMALLITSWYLGRRTTILFVWLIGFSSVAFYWINFESWLMVLFASDPPIVTVISWVMFFSLFSLLLLEYMSAMAERQRQLRLSAEQLALLHDIDVGILAAKSMPEIVQAAIQPLQHLAPNCVGHVAFFDLSQNEMYFLSQKAEVAPGVRVKIEDTPLVERLAQGHTAVYPDLRQLSPISRPWAILRDNGTRAVVAAPIIVQQELMGVLGLFSTEPNIFLPEHAQVVEQVALSLAVAIQSSHLLENERIARRQAETLREVANSLNTSLDQSALLDLVLEQLAYVIPYDRAVILLKKQEDILLAAQRGMKESLDTWVFAQTPTLPNIRRVMSSRAPLTIPDTTQDAGWVFLPGVEEMRCWLGVPMIVHDELIGLLMLDKREPHFYKTSDELLAQAFANQAAIAIENGRLYQELQQQANKLAQRAEERMRDLTVLYDVSAITRDYGELEPLLDSALKTVLSSLGCFAGAVHLLGEDGVLHLLNEQGVPDYVRPHLEVVSLEDNWLQHLLSGDEYPTSHVIDMAQTIYGSLFTILPGQMTLALVAMRSKGQLIGVLTVAHRHGASFSPEQLALLESIGGHIAVMIENGRLHRHAQQLAVMQERERLARALHDSVTQSLYALALFAEAANELAEAGQVERARVHLKQIGQTSLQALREMRLMLYELRSTTLLEEGLVHALQYRLENVEERANIETTLMVHNALHLPAEVEEGLYRVSQEALNNIIKHARATQVDVTLEQKDGTFKLTIADNGRGFNVNDSDSLSEKIGLTMMRRQVEQFGGCLTLDTHIGQGTTVTVTVNLARLPAPL
jgi:signal transduction histidine kinase/putative methionine-R-sulfoxide reductase with GAF domain